MIQLSWAGLETSGLGCITCSPKSNNAFFGRCPVWVCPGKRWATTHFQGFRSTLTQTHMSHTQNPASNFGRTPRTMLKIIRNADVHSYLWLGDCPLLTFIYPGFDCGPYQPTSHKHEIYERLPFACRAIWPPHCQGRTLCPPSA